MVGFKSDECSFTFQFSCAGVLRLVFLSFCIACYRTHNASSLGPVIH